MLPFPWTNFLVFLLSIIFTFIITVSLSQGIHIWRCRSIYNSQDTKEMGLNFWHGESFANPHRDTVHKLCTEDKRTLEKWMYLSRTYTCYDLVRLWDFFSSFLLLQSVSTEMRRFSVLLYGELFNEERKTRNLLCREWVLSSYPQSHLNGWWWWKWLYIGHSEGGTFSRSFFYTPKICRLL